MTKRKFPNVDGRAPNPIRTASPTMRRLLEIAQSRGYQNKTLSRELGLHVNQISHWRAGKHEPRIMTVEHLAQVLGVSIELREEEAGNES